MALNASRLDRLPYRTYVLLGDSEMTEGSQWETIQLADYYHASNLIGIIDVNRLGQRGETMFGHDIDAYATACCRVRLEDDRDRWSRHARRRSTRFATPRRNNRSRVMIVARTVKGKGISFVEDADGWHGKALDEDQWKQALRELPTSTATSAARLPPPKTGVR